MRRHWLKMAAWAAGAELLGTLGAVFTVSAIPSWYVTLMKPAFSPPNWIFGPVWGILYALIGAAGFLIYARRDAPGRKRALAAYAIQFALNLLWTPVFFGMRNPPLGLAVIALLFCMIIVTIVRFYSVSRAAALLLVPYLLWVAFATMLNLSIVLLN